MPSSTQKAHYLALSAVTYKRKFMSLTRDQILENDTFKKISDNEILTFIKEEIKNKGPLTEKEKNTLTRLAAKFGKTELISYLIDECQADLYVANSNCHYPIHIAVLHGQTEVISLLVNKYHADINIRTPDNTKWPLVAMAAYSGQLDTLKLLIQLGANIKATDSDGNSALHDASIKGQTEIIRFLTDYLDINIKNESNKTPLAAACSAGKLESVKMLIDLGAQHNYYSKNGLFPIHHAAKSGQPEIIRYLVKNAKVNPNLKTISLYQNTPILVASQFGELECLKELIYLKADLNITDVEGRHAIHDAAEFNQIPIIKYLLKNHQVDINLTTQNGLTTPLYYAALSINNNLHTLNKLKEYGATPLSDELKKDLAKTIIQDNSISQVKNLIDFDSSLKPILLSEAIARRNTVLICALYDPDQKQEIFNKLIYLNEKEQLALTRCMLSYEVEKNNLNIDDNIIELAKVERRLLNHKKQLYNEIFFIEETAKAIQNQQLLIEKNFFSKKLSPDISNLLLKYLVPTLANTAPADIYKAMSNVKISEKKASADFKFENNIKFFDRLCTQLKIPTICPQRSLK